MIPIFLYPSTQPLIKCVIPSSSHIWAGLGSMVTRKEKEKQSIFATSHGWTKALILATGTFSPFYWIGELSFNDQSVWWMFGNGENKNR